MKKESPKPPNGGKKETSLNRILVFSQRDLFFVFFCDTMSGIFISSLPSIMKKSSNGNGLSLETLILSNEISKNRTTQIATSILLLAVLGIQIYLFVAINQMIQSGSF